MIVCEGPQDGSGRLRSSRRRTVFRTQQPVSVPIKGSVGLSLGIFPLTCDGGALGVVEVLGPTTMVEGRVDVLSALVGQSALVLNSARVQSETERALAGMSALLRLASEPVWATTATEVLRFTAKACHDHLDVPVAGVSQTGMAGGGSSQHRKAWGARRRARLRASLQTFVRGARITSPAPPIATGSVSAGHRLSTASRPYGLVPPSFCSVTFRMGKANSRKGSPRSSGQCYLGSAGASDGRGIGRVNSASLGPPMTQGAPLGRSGGPGAGVREPERR